MKDIYQTNQKLADAWRLDGALLTIEKGQMLAATGIEVTYGRPLSHIRPINRDTRYMFAGDPTGNIRLSAIVGPSSGIKAFLTQYADICKIKENVLTIKPAGVNSCEGDEVPDVLTAQGCIISGLSLTVQKTEGASLVLTTVSMEFLALSVD